MSSFFPSSSKRRTNRFVKWWQRLPANIRRRKLVRGGIFVIGGLWLASGGGGRAMRWLDVGASHPELTPSEGPAIEATGRQSIVLRENGQKVLEFEAERIVISADHVFATTENVTRGVLYREGKPYLQLKAERVRLNQQTRDWEAIGTLHASGPHGFTVVAQRASWDQQSNQLSCPEQVKGTIRGLGFDTRRVLYDLGQNQLKCPEKVLIMGEHGTFEGKSAVVDTKTRRVEFKGGAEIVMRPSARNAKKPLPLPN